eukprot:jgi/Ulvmu1/11095/UM070_0010.1
MASASEIKHFKKAFGEFECDDDLVWHSAAGLALQLGLSASVLAEQFELFALNKKKLDEPITKQFFSIFSEHLKKEKAKENVSTNRSTGASSALKPSAALSPRVSVAKPQVHTPVESRAADVRYTPVDVEMADVPVPSHLITTSLEVTPMLNGGVPDAYQASGARFQLHGPQVPTPFRMLSSFLPEAAAHLERRINAMEAHLRSRGWDLTPVNTSSAENVAVVGRVCHSADAVTSSVATLEFEGSRAESDGARVKLDCSLLTKFSLFPGQVVGIKGRNPTGSCLTAHDVFYSFPGVAAAPSPALSEQASQPCRIIVAAGPFVPVAGALTFDALHAVLTRCRAVHPDALLLCGPFIPDSHPALKQLRVTFQELFAQQVLAPLQELQRQCSKTQVMLMPAAADAHHLPVHPQPPLPATASVDMLPSPAHLCAGGCAVSVSSSNLLLDLSSATVGKLDGQDRISRLFEHVLQQMHMYPVFPPALNACIDYAHTKHLEIPCTPKVLVLPAPFPPCVKLVDVVDEGSDRGHKALCINPGYACKGSTGTFIDMMLHDISSPDVQKGKVSSVKWSSPGT